MAVIKVDKMGKEAVTDASFIWIVLFDMPLGTTRHLLVACSRSAGLLPAFRSLLLASDAGAFSVMAVPLELEIRQNYATSVDEVRVDLKQR